MLWADMPQWRTYLSMRFEIGSRQSSRQQGWFCIEEKDVYYEGSSGN